MKIISDKSCRKSRRTFYVQ